MPEFYYRKRYWRIAMITIGLMLLIVIGLGLILILWGMNVVPIDYLLIGLGFVCWFISWIGYVIMKELDFRYERLKANGKIW